MNKSSSDPGNVRENETKEPGSIFRDTALRYIGYMGHLGWICRSIIPHYITSMATVTYVCADAFVRTSASSARGESDREVLMTAGDVFLWHFLASFALPGIFLHGVNSITCQMQSFRSKCRPRSRFYLLPCFLSSLTIPFIMKPIDRSVDELMDKYIRKSTKGGYMEDNDECEDGNNMRFKWFYEQSKDLHALELERYHQKLKDAKERQQMPSPKASSQPPTLPVKPDNDDTSPEKEREQMLRRSIEDFPQVGTQTSRPPKEPDPSDNLQTKAVQVDRTTRPPKPQKQEKMEENPEE